MTSFAGKRVLIVEDEAILAMSIEDMLSDLGCVVVGPALSLAQAQPLAAHEPLDAAVLDVNMGDAPSFGIADMLRRRSVPFCFSTGYGTAGLPPEYAVVPVLTKPYGQPALASTLSDLLGR